MKFKVSPDECAGLTAISFDGLKRRLITVSEDGIVKLWNFNNGRELDVLPIAVNKKVTCIVCTEDRVFMSGRNSKLIYDLNINEYDYRFLEHEYLNGLCTNVQNSKSDFPIICLKTRMATPSTATLLTSANGYIYAWSVHPKGHLLAKFRAANDEGAVITTMSTDEYEKTLLTGDSTGRIYLWAIQCFGYKTQTSKEPHEDAKKFHVSLCPPPLLHSWQAHLTGLVSVKCDPACTKIITAGLDCNVQLWTNTGCYIGLFGKDKWDAMQVSPEGNADQVQKIEPPVTLDRSNTPEIKTTTPRGNLRYLDDYYYIPEDASLELIQERYKWLQAFWQRFGLSGYKTLDSPQHLQQSADVVEQEKSTHSQAQFKPCPPQTSRVRDGTEHEPGQSSHLNQTRKTKYGRVLRNPQTDTLKCDVPKPNILPGKQGSEETSKHVRFPSIQHKVQLISHQTQLEPLPPQISLTMGGTDMKSSLHMQQSVGAVKQEQSTHSQTQFKPHPPQTPRVRVGTDLKQNSPQNQPRSRHGLLKTRQADTLKGGILKPNT